MLWYIIPLGFLGSVGIVVAVWNILTQRKPFPSEKYCPELIPDGLVVIADVASSNFKIYDLELVSFMDICGDQYSSTENLRQRAITLYAGLGLVDCIPLLNHRGENPAKLRIGRKRVVLLGTILCERGRRRQTIFRETYSPCLYFADGRWHLYFDLLTDPDYRDERRLLRIKFASPS